MALDVRLSVRPTVCLSVCPSVRPLTISCADNSSFITDPIFFKLSQIVDLDMQLCIREIIFGFGFSKQNYCPLLDFIQRFCADNSSFITDPIFFKLSQIVDLDMQLCIREIIFGFGFSKQNYCPLLDFIQRFCADNSSFITDPIFFKLSQIVDLDMQLCIREIIFRFRISKQRCSPLLDFMQSFCAANYSFITDPIFFKLSKILGLDMQLCIREIIFGF